MAFLAALMALLIVLVARRFMVGAVTLLPALLFMGFILYGGLDPTHHWFSAIIVMAAMLVLLDGATLPRVAVVGGLCGLAACFTQTKGAAAVAAFVTYLVWKMRTDRTGASEVWRRCLLLCGAAAGVFFAANAYFIGAAGLRQWVYCLIVYPIRFYPAPTLNNWRVVLYDSQWRSTGRLICYLFLFGTVPLVYLVFLFTMHRHRKDERQDVPWDKLLLVTLSGLGMFISIASAPSMKRVSTVSAPAIVLLVWLLNRPGKARALVKAILAVAALAFAIVPAVHTQLRWRAYLDLPAGRMALIDPTLYGEYVWVQAHTHPGEFFFGMPPFYTSFHLLNPAATETVETTEYTRPEQVAALIRALESHPVPILILRQSATFLVPRSPHRIIWSPSAFTCLRTITSRRPSRAGMTCGRRFDLNASACCSPRQNAVNRQCGFHTRARDDRVYASSTKTHLQFAGARILIKTGDGQR